MKKNKKHYEEIDTSIMKKMLFGTKNEKKKILDAMINYRNNLIKRKKELIDICLKKKYLDKKEVKFFEEDDDSIEYLDAIAHQDEFNNKERLIFVTTHRPLLKKAVEFNRRFKKLKLIDIKQAIQILKNKKDKETSYIG